MKWRVHNPRCTRCLDLGYIPHWTTGRGRIDKPCPFCNGAQALRIRATVEEVKRVIEKAKREAVTK